MQAVTQIRWVSRPWDDPCAHHSTWFLAESQGDQALRLGVRGLTPDHSQEHKPGHQVVVGGSRFLHGLGDLGVHRIRVGGRGSCSWTLLALWAWAFGALGR